MMRRTLKTLSFAAVASCALAGSAMATSLSLQYLGAASGYRYLNIQESPVTPVTGAPATNLLAGAFQMRDTTTNSALGDFIAWCMDVTSWLGTSGTYPYESTTSPFSNSYGLDAAQQNRVQGFFDANYFVGLEQDIDRSAGFQMGLWEALYDDDYSLTAGTMADDGEFRGIAGNAAANAAFAVAGQYLDEASGYSGGKRWQLAFLESTSSPNRQNLVTVSPVPLPAAGIMLLAGLAGLGVAARRRRS